MIAAILVLLLLPIINTSKIRSSKFRPIFSKAYWIFFSNFIILGWIGQKPVESPYIEIGMFSTAFYFAFLLILLPLIGLLESEMIKCYNGDMDEKEYNSDEELENELQIQETYMYFGHIPQDDYVEEDLYLLDQYFRIFFFVDDWEVTTTRIFSPVNFYFFIT